MNERRSSDVPAAGGYISFLALVAVLVLGTSLWVLEWQPQDLADPAVLLLGGLGAVSVVFPLRFHHDGDVTGFNLTTAVSLTLLWLLPDAAGLVVASVMTTVGYAVATRSVVKTVFNAAQVTVTLALSMTAARFVVGGPFAGEILDVRVLSALVLAAGVAAVANTVLVSELLHRMAGSERRRLITEISGLTAWVIVSDSTIAVLLTILAEKSSYAVVLAVPMFAGLLLGYRGILNERQTAMQAERLHDTSRQLLDAAVDVAALKEAVNGLRQLFGAERALLASTGDAVPGWAGSVVAAVHRTGKPVRASSDQHVLAAPVRLDGDVVGVLVVEGRRGVEAWGAADVDLLSTVAGEIAATLRTRRLLRQVEHERSQLAAEKGKLTDVLRSASDGIVVLDAEGFLAACNPAMAAMLGLEHVELGRAWGEVLALHDEEGRPLHEAAADPLGAALSGRGRVERASATLRRPDGEVRWLRCSAAPVVSDGAADGVVLVAVDVTRERELEHLRGDFIATVSHELRTPLTPLSGFIGLLRDRGGELDADRRSMMLAAMEKQIDRLSALIGDLLQVADMERGMARLAREQVALDAVLAQVVELEAVAESQRDRVRVVVRPVDVVADEDAVRRILRALVSNGLKHTGGLVEVLIESEDGEGVVRVRDEGPVIPASSRHTIFEPFRRLGDHLHRTQGPGLGLSISRSLAEALDGSVEVGTVPDGAGNEFVLRLPLATTSRQQSGGQGVATRTEGNDLQR